MPGMIKRTPTGQQSLEEYLRADFKRVEGDVNDGDDFVRGYLAAEIEIAAWFTKIDKDYLIAILREFDLECATSIW